MRETEVARRLREADREGVWAFTSETLDALMGGVNRKYFNLALHRLTEAGVLERASRGIYVNPAARSRPDDPRRWIVPYLRPREFSYVSLETVLSEAGIISQASTVLTCMTTGRSGRFETPWGVVEFQRTKREISPEEGVDFVEGEPIPVAGVERAWIDLQQVGRNLDLVSMDDLQDEIERNRDNGREQAAGY